MVRQFGGEGGEVALVAPGVAIADDEQAAFGAADGDVEEVGAGGRPGAGTRAGGIRAEDQDELAGR